MGEAEFIEAAIMLGKSEALMACSIESLLGALLNAAVLGLRLSPTLGECWIIPRSLKSVQNGRDVWTNQAVFQVGYKGWQKLAMRTGAIEYFDCKAIYSNDFFDYEHGTSAFLTHRPTLNHAQRGNFIGAWAAARMKNSPSLVFEVMAIHEIEKRKMKSDTQRKSNVPSGIWNEWFDEMAVRAPITRLVKVKLAKDEVLLMAIQADEGVTLVDQSGVNQIAPEVVLQKTAAEVKALSPELAREEAEMIAGVDNVALIDQCLTKYDLSNEYKAFLKRIEDLQNRETLKNAWVNYAQNHSPYALAHKN
jgi:recombination protein RecT